MRSSNSFLHGTYFRCQQFILLVKLTNGIKDLLVKLRNGIRDFIINFFLPLHHFIQLSNNILQPPLQTYTSKYQNIAYILAVFIHKADVATQTKKLRIYLHTTNAFSADYNVTLIITFNCNLRNSTSKINLNSLKKLSNLLHTKRKEQTHEESPRLYQNHLS